MSDPRTRIVGKGYDAIASEYLEWAARIVGDPKMHYLGKLAERLLPGARILELGCGAGEPCTRRLAERFRVTGVDISGEQIRRARTNVPSAEFVQDDFVALELAETSFDAVAAFYSLNHVPRELLGGLFASVHRWLQPGGLFLASLGVGETDSWTGSWLGTTMFFSSWDPDTNRRLLGEAGFELLLDDLVSMHEPEPSGTSTFQWVLARR